MLSEVIILIAEDDEGHAMLIERTLRRAGIDNQLLRFRDGQETLDFLLSQSARAGRTSDVPYILLLDIHMPKIDGIQVLHQVKQDDQLKKMPVIMLTTTDDPREVERCHALGCNNYLTKPVEYEQLVEGIKRLGFFLMVVEAPTTNGFA